MLWSRKPIKAIIFDIGGVVVHCDMDGYLKVGSMMYGCTPEVLAPNMAPLIGELERGEIDSYGMWEDLGEKLQSQGIGVAQEPEKFDNLWTRMLRESLEIDTSVMTLCRELTDRLPVAALSNAIAEHATCLEEFGVYEPFNPCILSHEVGMRKPELGIYTLATELLNVPPQNCLFVDDLKVNIEAAKSLKMQTHLFVDQAGLVGELRKRSLL